MVVDAGWWWRVGGSNRSCVVVDVSRGSMVVVVRERRLEYGFGMGVERE